MTMTPSDRIADLRRQHREFSRLGYDGHNRQPQQTPMRTLGMRRRRRWWNRVLGHMALRWRAFA